MRNANVVEEHPDASETGQLREWIAAYLDGAKCTAKTQIKASVAFFDGEKVHFRLIDLIRFLEVRRVPAKKHNVWALIQSRRSEECSPSRSPEEEIALQHPGEPAKLSNKSLARSSKQLNSDPFAGDRRPRTRGHDCIPPQSNRCNENRLLGNSYPVGASEKKKTILRYLQKY